MDEVWKAIEAIGSLLVGIAAVIAAVKSKGDEPSPVPKPKLYFVKSVFRV